MAREKHEVRKSHEVQNMAELLFFPNGFWNVNKYDLPLINSQLAAMEVTILKIHSKIRNIKAHVSKNVALVLAL